MSEERGEATMLTALQRRLLEAPPWTVVTERDLSYLRVGGSIGGGAGSMDHLDHLADLLDDDVLVVACDSDGGLGPKPADTVAVDAGELGRFATRVPLLETVAAGATPVLVVDTLSVEMDPTGRAILDGVLAEAADAGLAPEAVTGSTEDNVPTVATGVGVTVLGRARVGSLRAGSARAPFSVVLLGRPMSAPAELFGSDHPEVVTVPVLMAAMEVDGVVEALPIGSRGVMHEYEQLAVSAGAVPRTPPPSAWPVAPNQSGGPSTACLLAVASVEPAVVAPLVEHLAALTSRPAWWLGTALPRSGPPVGA